MNCFGTIESTSYNLSFGFLLFIRTIGIVGICSLCCRYSEKLELKKVVTTVSASSYIKACSIFLEWQPYHSSSEGFGFHQNYHTKEMKAWQYICQFSIFLFIKKQISICYCLLFSMIFLII